jgi:BASS family bile acid:Na+ symporter
MQQLILFAVLAVMIYAVALDLRPADFRYVARHPRAVAAGLVAQFVLLPGATWLATLALDLPPAVEAAMLLVASCPGGALSNVITAFARGNLALSISISAVSNVLALVLTPLIFTLAVTSNVATAAWVRSIEVNPRDLWASLLLLLAVPVTAALLTSRLWPEAALRLRRPLGRIAVAALCLFIVAAVAAQWSVFVVEVVRTLPLVVVHNALGLAAGALAALIARTAPADLRAIVIEGGMQNSGLALGIIAAQFKSDLAMVAVASLWGIWHIVSGGSLALLWRWRDRSTAQADARASLEET